MKMDEMIYLCNYLGFVIYAGEIAAGMTFGFAIGWIAGILYNQKSSGDA